MAAIRTTTNILLNRVSQSAFSPKRLSLSSLLRSTNTSPQQISTGVFRCFSAPRYGKSARNASSRLSQVQQLLLEAEEHASSGVDEPTAPKIRLEHVSVKLLSTAGLGAHRMIRIESKVELRFNVKNATWLSERFREKIMQLEQHRINKDGEIVVYSKKTRAQQDNIDDALSKLQAIFDAAAYVPPPPSEELKKKIAELSAFCEQKRLQNKKVISPKESFGRSSWDYVR